MARAGVVGTKVTQIKPPPPRAKGAQGGDADSNLPFNSPLNTIAGVSNRVLKTGFIREAIDTPGRGRFSLYFQFNPTDITFSYAFNNNNIPPAFAADSERKFSNLDSDQSISFSLLFDRTYEVWRGEPSIVGGRPGPGVLGALWDVRAAERLIGITDNLDTAPQSNEVEVFLGEGEHALNFAGYFSSMAAGFTRFDANMTPTRAAIEVSLIRTFQTGAGAAGGDASTDANGNPLITSDSKNADGSPVNIIDSVVANAGNASSGSGSGSGRSRAS